MIIMFLMSLGIRGMIIAYYKLLLFSNTITKKNIQFLSILQFVPVVDLISYALLLKKIHKKEYWFSLLYILIGTIETIISSFFVWYIAISSV